MVNQFNKGHLQIVHKDIRRPIQGQGRIPRLPIIVAQPANTQDRNLRHIQEAETTANIQGNSLRLIQVVVTNIQDHRVLLVPGGPQAVRLIKEARVVVTVALQAAHQAVPHEVVLHPVILLLQEVARPEAEAVDLTPEADLPQAVAVETAAVAAAAVAAPADAGNNKIDSLK